MTDQPEPARVAHARRFVIRAPGHADMPGVEFPGTRHVIADDPHTGLIGATSVGHLIEGVDGATVHWADNAEQQRDQLAATLTDILGTFDTCYGADRVTVVGHRARRGVDPDRFARWQAALDQPRP
jgi:hypothetical protein